MESLFHAGVTIRAFCQFIIIQFNFDFHTYIKFNIID